MFRNSQSIYLDQTKNKFISRIQALLFTFISATVALSHWNFFQSSFLDLFSLPDFSMENISHVTSFLSLKSSNSSYCHGGKSKSYSSFKYLLSMWPDHGLQVLPTLCSEQSHSCIYKTSLPLKCIRLPLFNGDACISPFSLPSLFFQVYVEICYVNLHLCPSLSTQDIFLLSLIKIW